MKADRHEAILDQIHKIDDVYITIRAELDQATMTFGELMNLDVGSLVQLSRPTGENIDVYVEEALLGWGEVLLLDGMMTVRLADLRNARLPDLIEEEEAGQ